MHIKLCIYGVIHLNGYIIVFCVFENTTMFSAYKVYFYNTPSQHFFIDIYNTFVAEAIFADPIFSRS